MEQQPQAASTSAAPPHRTEVAIIGGGIIGLFNTLQYARRGIKVTLIDDLVGMKRSYKVGESLLVFSNMFLRTIGGLDDFIRQSVPKSGVWFTYGAEGKKDFTDTTEWGLERSLPKSYQDAFVNKLIYRSFVEDAQIVRPEAEDEMTAQARSHPLVTLLDTAKVKDLRLGENGQPHDILWENRATKDCGKVQADWVIDCSGRARYLAKKFGHVADQEELKDGFQTTAVWAQFTNVRKDMFGPEWAYHFSDGKSTRREDATLHLWGKGYWIWVIKLSKDRISIGVTFNQDIAPPGANFEEKFWDVIRRYRVFDNVLRKEDVLEFRVYKNVQYFTDTFISPKRYAMVGDAASIIDAYYSQGMSHSFVASWHIANVTEEYLREKRLNTEYIGRINESLREDWRMVRNIVKGKFTPAIADSRFFLLTHVLDLIQFVAVGIPRHVMGRWLVETNGGINRDSALHKWMQGYLSKQLFYSKSFLPPFSSRTARRLQGYLQRVITERALWRLEHGVQVPKVKSVVRFVTGPILFWRIFGKPKDAMVEISPDEIKNPSRRLMFTGVEMFPFPLKVSYVVNIFTFLSLYFHDWLSTSWAKLGYGLRSLFGGAPSPVPSQPVAPELRAAPEAATVASRQDGELKDPR